MLRVDWQSFGNCLRAHSVVEAKNWNQVEKLLGLSHARVINAAQGKPLGTEVFLTLCHWMKQDPLNFCVLATPSQPEGEG